MRYEKLIWDSDFFQKNVCKFNSRVKSYEDFRIIHAIMAENDFQLAYYASKTPLNTEALNNVNLEIKLVDKKTTYVKEVSQELTFHPAIASYENQFAEQKLLDLAIQSGDYSRFNVDEKIGRKKYEEMYRLWMENSVKRSIAKDVLIFREIDEICGFITVGEKNKRGDVGIIAVDSDYRGKGIGKKLMLAAEKWFADRGYTSLQVVTQGANIPACKLYENCGFTVESIYYYYHIWTL